MRDFEANVLVNQVVDPVVADTDADEDGSSVDLKDYKHVFFVANIGESGDTLSSSVYIELELEESDDDSSFTDVDDADMTNTVDGANDGTFAKIVLAGDDKRYVTQYKGSARYVRPVVNMTGTHTNGTPVSVTAFRFGARRVAVTQP